MASEHGKIYGVEADEMPGIQEFPEIKTMV